MNNIWYAFSECLPPSVRRWWKYVSIALVCAELFRMLFRTCIWSGALKYDIRNTHLNITIIIQWQHPRRIPTNTHTTHEDYYDVHFVLLCKLEWINLIMNRAIAMRRYSIKRHVRCASIFNLNLQSYEWITKRNHTWVVLANDLIEAIYPSRPPNPSVQHQTKKRTQWILLSSSNVQFITSQ